MARTGRPASAPPRLGHPRPGGDACISARSTPSPTWNRSWSGRSRPRSTRSHRSGAVLTDDPRRRSSTCSSSGCGRSGSCASTEQPLGGAATTSAVDDRDLCGAARRRRWSPRPPRRQRPAGRSVARRADPAPLLTTRGDGCRCRPSATPRSCSTCPGGPARHRDARGRARAAPRPGSRRTRCRRTSARSVTGSAQPVLTLDPSIAALDIVVVVGPGVVRAGAVDALGELARKAGIGVLNTWGAKGVERWDSPFHFGTIGLQARDFELAGLGTRDVVLTSGLDPDESARRRSGRPGSCRTSPPSQLGRALPRVGSVSSGPPTAAALRHDRRGRDAALRVRRRSVDRAPRRAAPVGGAARPRRGGGRRGRVRGSGSPARCPPRSRAASASQRPGRRGSRQRRRFVCGLETRPVRGGDRPGRRSRRARRRHRRASWSSPRRWSSGSRCSSGAPEGSLASSTAHVELLAATLGTDSGPHRRRAGRLARHRRAGAGRRSARRVVSRPTVVGHANWNAFS